MITATPTCPACTAPCTLGQFGSVQRHTAPCGAVCFFGCTNAVGVDAEEQRTQLHGHVPRLGGALACPNGCFGVPVEPGMVDGDRMLRSIADFVRGCEVCLAEEQQRLAPDNALISLLCDAVRLAREHARCQAGNG